MLTNKKIKCVNGYIEIDEFNNNIRLNIVENDGDSVFFTIDNIDTFVSKLKNIENTKNIDINYYVKDAHESQNLKINIEKICVFTVSGRGQNYSYKTVLIIDKNDFDKFVEYFVSGKYVNMINEKNRIRKEFEEYLKNLNGE